MSTRDEIQRIAAAMNALRPDWPVRSLVTFLESHQAGKPYRDLAIAAAAVATDVRTQTPNLLNEHGPWWTAAQAATGNTGPASVPRPDDPRCTEPGHDRELARNCRWCRSEQIAPDPATVPDPSYALSPEQVARNERWLRTIRAQTTTHAGAAGRTEEYL